MDNRIINLNRKIECTVVRDIKSEKKHILDHGLIGISPSNSYYSEENITNLIKWAVSTFKDFSFFIPDRWSIYTLMGQGYPEQKARMKTKKGDFRLKNKIVRAFKNNNIPEEMATKNILMASTLMDNEKYQEIHNICLEKFNNDKAFHEMCLSTSKFILSKSNEPIDEESVYTAVPYFLHELPLYLDTPKILTVPSSFCVYHNIPSFIKYIYRDNTFSSINQGFMVANVTE